VARARAAKNTPVDRYTFWKEILGGGTGSVKSATFNLLRKDSKTFDRSAVELRTGNKFVRLRENGWVREDFHGQTVFVEFGLEFDAKPTVASLNRHASFRDGLNLLRKFHFRVGESSWIPFQYADWYSATECALSETQSFEFGGGDFGGGGSQHEIIFRHP